MLTTQTFAEQKVFHYEGVTTYLSLNNLKEQHIGVVKSLAPIVIAKDIKERALDGQMDMYAYHRLVRDSNAYNDLVNINHLFNQDITKFPKDTPAEFVLPSISKVKIKDLELYRVHFPVIADSREDVELAVDMLYAVLKGLFGKNVLHMKAKHTTSTQSFHSSKNTTYLSVDR